MEKNVNPIYKLRFCLEYNCGGCLWSDNEAAYQKYGFGTLDGEIFDADTNVMEEVRIKLPDLIQKKVLEIEKLYSKSLDWDNPGGGSLWSDIQWKDFYTKTRNLYKEICETLGDSFEVVYTQEK